MGNNRAGNLKIVTLCENTVQFAARRVLGEHGLAMLLETGGKKILFDTGADLALMHNARVLGVDLSGLDAVVLSHGHYDHTGGLKELLAQVGPVDIYAHPEVFTAKYAVIPGREPVSIGIPWTRRELEKMGARFHLHREPVDLGGGVLLSGEIPRVEEGETVEPTFYRQSEEGLVSDPVSDDQAIYVETPKGTVVLLGCTHTGLVNTLRHALALTGKGSLHAVMGGTHLITASEERINYTLKMLEKFGLEQVSACHCTGPRAAFMLAGSLGGRFNHQTAGSRYEF